MGALDDPARARAELERMRLRHAGTTAAAHAEQALRTLGGTWKSGLTRAARCGGSRGGSYCVSAALREMLCRGSMIR